MHHADGVVTILDGFDQAFSLQFRKSGTVEEARTFRGPGLFQVGGKFVFGGLRGGVAGGYGGTQHTLGFALELANPFP